LYQNKRENSGTLWISYRNCTPYDHLSKIQTKSYLDSSCDELS